MNRLGNGYTILEVLIFIAVSAFIFIAAMVAVSGRQQQVQFAQSVREFDGKISDIINDVTTGYYPSNNTIRCAVNANDRPSISPAATNQNKGVGTNSSCLSVGKALQFVPKGVSENKTKFLVYNLVGRRYTSSSSTVKTIDETKPVAVATAATNAFDDPTEVATIRFNVEITKVFEISDSGSIVDFDLLAILSNFEGSRPSASVSSSQSVQIGGITANGSKFNRSKQDAISIINNLTENSSIENGYINTSPQSGVVICLRDPDNRKASVTIGVNGTATTILQFDEYNLGCDS